MGTFFRENWIWILGPVLLVLVGFVVMVALQGSQDASPFIYTID